MLDGESSEYVRAVNSSLAFTLQARAFFFKGTSMLEALCGNYESELGPEIMIFNIGPAWTESKANRLSTATPGPRARRNGLCSCMDLRMIFGAACEKAKLQADRELEKERQETQEARKAAEPKGIANPYLKNTNFLNSWRAESGNLVFEVLESWGRK